MTIELKVPDAGESIDEVRIVEWLKQPGDTVQEDENVVELETDKASLALPAPGSGVLSEVLKGNGESAAVGETIARIDGAPSGDNQASAEDSESAADTGGSSTAQESSAADEGEQPRGEKPTDEQATDEQATGTRSGPKETPEPKAPAVSVRDQTRSSETAVTPSARRELRRHGLSPDDIEPRGQRIRREDVQRHVDAAASAPAATTTDQQPAAGQGRAGEDEQLTEVVPMSPLRRRIAERLVKAQQQAAILTTFNQIDMSEVMELRHRHREQFEEEYAVDLGYMSFFVKAAVDALKHFPALNAEVRGEEIVYRNYYHISIAVGSRRGLVVPVLRYAERLSFAEIEAAIDDFAERADNNRIEPRELQDGTFTISNGGVYGSLLSTPIINPPQSGVLGMHAIEDRPIARNGAVLIRPMMYVALSYDHRIVDGRESVLFLRRIKEAIEQPARMLIEV